MSNHWFRLNLDLQQKHIPVEPMHAIKVNNIPTSNLSTGGGILNLHSHVLLFNINTLKKSHQVPTEEVLYF